MEQLVEKLKDILEVEELDLQKRFADYDEWDSLSTLSVLAMLDSDYNKQMTAQDIKHFESIEAFCKAVLEK